MLRVAQPYRKSGFRDNYRFVPESENMHLLPGTLYLPLSAKVLAWALFLIFFIEAGTLGLIPKEFYFVYRNVRLSDILMYGLIIYSLINVREYSELYNSRAFIIVKLLLLYIFVEFIISVIQYKLNVLEYFFRLKMQWMSLLVFPYMLLLKRGGFPYLIKLILPVAVVSNIFYIITALTGISVFSDVSMVQQDLPGGLKVYRIFGGTFYGEFFFLGIVYCWNEFKFRILHFPFIIIFALPHVLAFGRNAWLSFTFAVIFIILWSSYRKREVTSIIRQVALISVLLTIFLYFFNQFIPQSEYLTEAVEARIQQGRDDIAYGEGTYGTRVANIEALVRLWYNNPIIGVGFHPMWVIRAETAEENIYSWGFADVRWAGVLAAFGAIGFLFAIIFQLYYMIVSFKLLAKIKKMDLNYFFLLMFLIFMLRDTFINYTYYLTTVTLSVLGSSTSFFVATFVYLYEKNKSEEIKNNNNGKTAQ